MRLPRPYHEHVIPLQDPDLSAPVPPMDAKLLTAASEWFWFPVGAEGAERFVRWALKEAGTPRG